MAATKKGAAMLAIKFGGGAPPREEPEDDEEAPMSSEGDDLGGTEMAAGEILDAVKSGDKQALAEALQSFVEMCR